MKKINKNLSSRKKIAWVTPDYFIDCDFNPEILGGILKEYDIVWYILLPLNNARFKEMHFADLKMLPGLTIEFIYARYRQRDPRRLKYYYNLFSQINNQLPNLVYLNCVPDPYMVPILWMFDKKRTIICAHDGQVHAGFDFKYITAVSFKLSYRQFKHVCMFSSSQAKIFHNNFPNAEIYTINLALKSFGRSIVQKPKEEIVFLSFGVINYSKNIELLIQAACNIYEKGFRNFKVSINGYCDNWSYYESFILYPEIFICKIGIIDNAEIPALFANASYFVQPYRHVSQSGAMKVAFYYNLPVIASNYSGFSDEIKEGTNGFLFEAGSLSDLERVMIKTLTESEVDHDMLLERMKAYTFANYSPNIIANKYLKMFNTVSNEA